MNVETGENDYSDIIKFLAFCHEEAYAKEKQILINKIKKEDLAKTIVPVSEEEKTRFVMSHWGKRKIDRYSELLKDGLNINLAYHIVEYNNGTKVEV